LAAEAQPIMRDTQRVTEDAQRMAQDIQRVKEDPQPTTQDVQRVAEDAQPPTADAQRTGEDVHWMREDSLGMAENRLGMTQNGPGRPKMALELLEGYPDPADALGPAVAAPCLCSRTSDRQFGLAILPLSRIG
jgi:hypothetical protein